MRKIRKKGRKMNKKDKINVAALFYFEQGYRIVDQERMGWDLILNRITKNDEDESASLIYVVIADEDTDPQIGKDYYPSVRRINGITTYVEVNYLFISEADNKIRVDQYVVNHVCEIVCREEYLKEEL